MVPSNHRDYICQGLQGSTGDPTPPSVLSTMTVIHLIIDWYFIVCNIGQFTIISVFYWHIYDDVHNSKSPFTRDVPTLHPHKNNMQ